jgi:NAD-dependent SIR2 family protein deacetylase
MSEAKQKYKEAAEAISSAEVIVITAGAGMGVDSGLPDFRGNQGFWNAYPPYQKLNLSFIDMANPGWFDNDPGMAWGFYGHRLNLYRETQPHRGFEILYKWARQKEDYFVFTSNVDGHFQKMNFAEEKVMECHGAIDYFQCSEPCRDDIWQAEEIQFQINTDTMEAVNELPRCKRCDRIARPNILMFGDWNWISDRTSLQQQNFNRWLRNNRKSKIVVIECGAGTGVPTVRMTSEDIFRHYDASLIRINIREPQVPPGGISFSEGALTSLVAIDGLL